MISRNRPAGARETLLLVEDDPGVRRVLCEILVRDGYIVLEAGEGFEALMLAEGYQGPIHLIITDVVTPHMACGEWLEYLRRDRPGLSVVYISGYSEDVINRFGVSSAGANFLRKPFAPDELARKVREVLEGPGGLDRAWAAARIQASELTS